LLKNFHLNVDSLIRDKLKLKTARMTAINYNWCSI